CPATCAPSVFAPAPWAPKKRQNDRYAPATNPCSDGRPVWLDVRVQNHCLKRAYAAYFSSASSFLRRRPRHRALRRQLVKRERRDQAEDALRDACRHGDEIGVR